MKRKKLNYSRFIGVAALCLSFASFLPAQTDVTTSRISGTVRDANGAPLPGVTVEGRNEETGLVVPEVTDSDGVYRLLNLPTGRYTVTASLAGLGAVSRPGIRLVLGSTPTVDLTLTAAISETITVSAAAPIVEVTNTTASTTIDTEQLKGLPSSGRDFRSLVLMTPQTRLEGERGSLSISGERGINTSVMIDGVDFNNPFFGATMGVAEGRAPLSISQESIKELSVITNGASVEFGRSGGGFVNMITKSGTNQINGSAFYYWQPDSLISNFADGREPAEQDKKQYGGSIGGPIMRDRLFFFASYDQQDQRVTIPLNINLLDADIFARYPALASPPQFVQTRDGSVAFGRVDFQASNSHRFMVRGNFTDYEGDNGTNASANRTLANNGLEGMNTEVYVGQYSGTFGSNLINDFNATISTEDTPRVDKSPTLPEIRYGSFTYGGVSFLPIVSTVERTAFSDTVSYLWGDHVMKGGVDYNDTSVDQIFKGNWRGFFTFAGGNEANLLAGRWTQYQQFGGLGGLTADEAGAVAFGQKELALFIQDQWFINSNLTVTAGIRWEQLDNPDDPILNPRSVNANGSFNLNGEIPDVDDQFSPRVGFSWSPDASRTVVRGTVGRYWSRTPAILFAQLYTSNGLRGTQYIINAGATGPTDPLAPGWGENFNPVGVERIDFTRIPTPSRLGVSSIDPEFTNPRTDRATLMVERELARETAAGLELTYAEASHLERLTDINLQYDGTTAANGLPRYSSTRPNPFYGRISTYISDAESEYKAIGATFRRRFADTLRIFAGLTWSEDKDNDSNERNFAGTQVEDFNNLAQNWGYSNRDQRWRGSLSGVWDSPWWGLQLSGAYRYLTGSPFSAARGDDANNDGFNNTDRPTIAGVHFERNSFRQPDFQTLDLRLGKEFRFSPGSVSIFAECFNCMDEENWFISNFTWGIAQTPSATFGLANNPGTPRIIQVATRIEF